MNKLFQVMNGHSMLGLEYQLVDVDVYFLLRSSSSLLLAQKLTSSTGAGSLC